MVKIFVKDLNFNVQPYFNNGASVYSLTMTMVGGSANA
jgi:hypothetical protein